MYVPETSRNYPRIAMHVAGFIRVFLSIAEELSGICAYKFDWLD